MEQANSSCILRTVSHCDLLQEIKKDWYKCSPFSVMFISTKEQWEGLSNIKSNHSYKQQLSINMPENLFKMENLLLRINRSNILLSIAYTNTHWFIVFLIFRFYTKPPFGFIQNQHAMLFDPQNLANTWASSKKSGQIKFHNFTLITVIADQMEQACLYM